MNITISKNDLSTALRRVQGAASSRTSIRALSCVLLRTAGGIDDLLQLVATNCDMQISHTVPASVKEAGVAALPISGFGSFVSQFSHPEVGISVDDKFKATFKSGGATCSLSGINPSEFVELKTEQRKSFVIEQSALKAALKRTLIAVSTDDTRPILNGVFFELKCGNLTIVSTSGTQLSRVTHEIEGDGISATLPTKAATELARLLGDKGDVVVGFGENNAEFIIGDTVLTSKLVGEKYPNFRQVIPLNCTERITMSREEFQSAVQLVAAAEVDRGKFPKILVTFEQNRMLIESVWQASSASDSFAIKYSGKDVAMPLAPEQLLGILGVLSEDEIHVEIIDHLSPLVVKAGNFLGLTMPFRK